MKAPWTWFRELETSQKVPIIAASIAAIITAFAIIIAALVAPTDWLGLTDDETPVPPTATSPPPTSTPVATLTPTPPSASRIEYAADLQLIACDQTNDARAFARDLLRLITDFVVDPSPERITSFIVELRDISGTSVAVTDDAIEQVENMEPPGEFRLDHQTFLASLRNINGTYSGLLLRSRDLGDEPSLNELDSLLTDLLSILSAGLAGFGQEDFSPEFEELITCQFPAEEPVVPIP